MDKYYFDHVLPSEVNFISQTTFSDPHLIYRPPAVLHRSQSAGYLLACRSHRRPLLGWIEIYPLWKNDWGISTLYIIPPWRGKGLSSRLITQANKKLLARRVFTVTNHPGVIKVLRTLYFRPLSIWRVPKLTLASLLVTRYYHPISWFKLFTLKGSGLRFYVRP